ncbi:MAG: ABC transporter permease [Streptosporangiales bacterium]|nr:ABC transporter permease [Streptosporangiales bacterium]
MSAGLDLTPAPGAASVPRRVLAYAAQELRQQLRNGEQLLLTAVIPVGALILFTQLPIVAFEGRPVDQVTPGVLALAVISTAFTGQAIATGFERRYGALKRLGATPLGRPGLLAGKTIAVLAVELLQLALLGAVALVLGWRPVGNVGSVVLLLVLGTAAFSGLGLLLAGALRAEATLAAANLIYVALLVLSGLLLPLQVFPAPLATALQALPSTALAAGLRDVLAAGAGLPVLELLVLAGWAVVALAAAVRTFRWE